MIVAIVVSNLMYLVGAVAAMVLLSLIVVLRHRRPKSIEANMKTFNRGLQALAPENAPSERTVTARPMRVQTRSRSVQTFSSPAAIIEPTGGDRGVSEAETG
jgi:hypothetical protein